MNNSKNVFSKVSYRSPGRSMFDLSYDKKFSCDMGELIPVMCDEVVPGDIIKIGNEAVIRFQPLVAPVLHEINMYVHYFFVPYRLLWNEKTNALLSQTGTWEGFITGGETGTNTDTLPRWTPSVTTIGSLWDYLGFPTGITPTGALPLDFPRRAYNFIYNEFYRDENIITAVALTNETILQRCWEKDYFTSSLPWQQKGTAPALPISGTSSAVFPAGNFIVSAPSNIGVSNTAGTTGIYTNNATQQANAQASFNNNTVNLASATTFDIEDLRLAFQIQRWLERNARAGSRYTEFLKSHFGVSPRDDRLDRPEYVGGSKSPIIVSEVLQTSKTESGAPQGNLAGHGLSVSRTFCGKYRVQEFGLIMGLMSVMPRSVYQQGINRQWLRTTKYDFYFPEFANLSEQAIIRAEIYANTVSGDNNTIFGYQGRYDEMRTKQSMVCGDMRDNFDFWHISRQFSSAPTLNATFLQCIPRKDIMAVPTVDALLVSFGNLIHAYRPLPASAEPGLIDH